MGVVQWCGGEAVGHDVVLIPQFFFPNPTSLSRLLTPYPTAGKSVYVKDKLMNGLERDVFVPIFLTFSAQTSANQTQNILLSKLDKRRKGVFGPRVGTKATVFVDDLNMPVLERYGAQPPIELLRQYLDHGYWFDLTDTTMMKLVDVLIIGAMGPPGGGRNPVTPRFIRHMHVVCITDFDNETRTRIFSAVMSKAQRDGGFSMELQGMGPPIVAATLNIFNAAVENLLPTPAKSHYTFNLRDFARVINGVLLLPAKKCNDKQKLIRLWGHEVLRVFYDRLVDDKDRGWLIRTIKDVEKNQFKLPFETVYSRQAQPGAKEPTD